MSKFDWKAVLGTVAPTLATAFGGPLAGLATKAVVEALGLPESSGEEQVVAAIKNATPEQLLLLKNADYAFKVKMKELDVNLEEILFKDRDSARNLLMQTRAKTPAALSWLVVVCTMGLEGALLLGYYPTGIPEIVLGRILGTLDTSLGIVLTFWLGAAHREPANRGTG